MDRRTSQALVIALAVAAIVFVWLAQTRRDELISVVQLYKALGGGWNLKDPSDWIGPGAAK